MTVGIVSQPLHGSNYFAVPVARTYGSERSSEAISPAGPY